jgi:hypothetical protein
MKPNEQDHGPYRIDLVRAIWNRIARTVDALHAIAAVDIGAEQLKQLVDGEDAGGRLEVDSLTLTCALRVMASQDGMHAGDWLRARAVDASLPRRKAPAALELQLRLRGVNCRRFVAVCRPGEEYGGEDAYRVTVTNVRGDIASVESTSFANALEGAIKMAGARVDGLPEDQ